jgi:NCS1 family nucleobase:cation symporter-1
MRAVVAFVISAAISATVALVPMFSAIAPFSWFIGVIIGGGVYWIAMAGVSAQATALKPEATR